MRFVIIMMRSDSVIVQMVWTQGFTSVIAVDMVCMAAPARAGMGFSMAGAIVRVISALGFLRTGVITVVPTPGFSREGQAFSRMGIVGGLGVVWLPNCSEWRVGVLGKSMWTPKFSPLK